MPALQKKMAPHKNLVQELFNKGVEGLNLELSILALIWVKGTRAN